MLLYSKKRGDTPFRCHHLTFKRYGQMRRTLERLIVKHAHIDPRSLHSHDRFWLDCFESVFGQKSRGWDDPLWDELILEPYRAGYIFKVLNNPRCRDATSQRNTIKGAA